MKNIISSAQMREADQHTIENEPVTSIKLMERAALAFVKVFLQLVPDESSSVLVCCGTGNNGGDGLAIARLIRKFHYDTVHVWVARFSQQASADFSANLSQLNQKHIVVSEFFPGDAFPPIRQDVIIDALLGSGLNKPLEGDWLALAQHINQSGKKVLAVDIPTGLGADGVIPDEGQAVFAEDVISFQRPKLSFFLPESAAVMENFHVVDIRLHEAFIENRSCDFKLIEPTDIQTIYRRRKPFSHKGTYGHALIIAGEETTMGAALLSCGASLYSGAGLTTACIPHTGLTALNTNYPEVMYIPRNQLHDQWDKFDAIGIGPGLGESSSILAELLELPAKPLVLDADALNYLAAHPHQIQHLPKNCILTPHMKEFDRLFGTHTTWWERIKTAQQKANELQLIIVLKNRYTFIALPDNRVLINPTGNPAMASGGMGDVLTGMLTSFLAQGYSAEEAAILSCYLHGATGDKLAARGMAVIPASALLKEIPLNIIDP